MFHPAFLFVVVFIAHTGWMTNTAHSDETKAAQLWIKLAEQGDSFAQAQLGWMYENGEDVTQDYEKAMFWTRKSAEQGYARAQYNLGWMYYYGEGVAQDYEKAAEWYRRAAEQDNAYAQARLSVMVAKGQGVTADKKKAMEWYQQAAQRLKKDAERGDDYAQYTLGWLYAQGVKPDMKEALKWLRQTASTTSSSCSPTTAIPQSLDSAAQSSSICGMIP